MEPNQTAPAPSAPADVYPTEDYPEINTVENAAINTVENADHTVENADHTVDTSEEGRLAAARAKAAAAKASAAHRRASRASLSSQLSDGARSHSSQRSPSSARRGSIRAVLAAIDEAEAALSSADREAAAIDERLQLYSEVVALRKERRVVSADEQRARRQRELGTLAAAKHDPAVDAQLDALEAAAADSQLRGVWAAAVARDSAHVAEDDAAGWLRLNTENLAERLARAGDAVRAAQSEAATLYNAQAARINTNTDARDRTKGELEASLREEMESLAGARGKLQQLDREQRYHIKRGTHVKERQVPAQRQRDVAKDRVLRNETREFADKCALNTELTELTEQVRQGRRVLDDHRRSHAEVEGKLEAQLKETEESGREVHEMRGKLEKETEELKALKQDLQRVLQYVRTRNVDGYNEEY